MLSMTFRRANSWAFSSLLLAAACGGGDSSPSGGTTGGVTGGHCTSGSTCYQVTTPADYDVKGECEAVGSKWSADACPTSGYARKCTQKVTVTEDGTSREVTYVYFFPAGDTTACLGTSESLTGAGGQSGQGGAGASDNCARSEADDGRCGATVLGVTYGAAWRCQDNTKNLPCDNPVGSIDQDHKQLQCCP